MCGRYVVARTLGGELPELLSSLPGWPAQYENFNIAPTTDVPIVVEDVETTTGEVIRHADLAYWGLVPAWKQSFTQRPQPINARIETVATNGMFRQAFRYRRCLVPASGYYEWHVGADGVKQPFFIHAPHGLVFAGIFEDWGTDTRDARRSMAILTRPAVGPAAVLHDRLPVMLTPDGYSRWLGHDFASAGEAFDLAMAQSEHVAGSLQFHAVDRRVGNVRNSGPELCEPVAPSPSVG